MSTLSFKTNIHCEGCISAVKNPLDQAAGEKNWSVDLDHPERILSVKAGHEREAGIIQAVEKAGYTIKPVNPAEN